LASTVASRKSKGKRLQQWLAQKISDLLGIPWGKDELIASREMAQAGTDIRLIGEAKRRFNYACECKNTESINMWAAIKQAKSNQWEGSDWLLFVKKNHEDPVVVLDADVFFKLLKEIMK